MDCGSALQSLISSVGKPKLVEPDDALVEKCRGFLDARGFLRAVSGDEDHDTLAKALATLHANCVSGAKRGMLLAGPVGVGKTHAAVAIATAMKYPPIVLTPDTEVNVGAITSDNIRDTCHGKAYIVDDLGRSADRMDYGNRSNPWLTFLYRWSGVHAPLAPILYVTTNLDSKGLAEYCGSAIVSRLIDRMVVCRLKGPDKRMAQATLF